jgi:hypothetical protein
MSEIDDVSEPDGAPVFQMQHDLRLRDWFAGQVLTGMHARDAHDEGLATPQQRARLAYIDADAMLEARKVQP